MHSSCPSQAKLTALLKGELPEASRNALRHHLKSCSACRQRLDWIAGNDGNRPANVRRPARSATPSGKAAPASQRQPVESRATASVSTPKPSLSQAVWWWCRSKPSLCWGALSALALVGLFAVVASMWRGQAHRRQVAEQEDLQAQQATVHLEIEKHLRSSNSAPGLALLAHLLRQQPTNAVVVERLINALSYRSFCLPVAPLEFPPRAVAAGAIHFSRDGRWLVMAGAGVDGQARVWDSQTGQLLQALPAGDDELWQEFGRDGKRLTTAANNRTDGTKLVIDSSDHTVRVWNSVRGQPLCEPVRHEAAVLDALVDTNLHRMVTWLGNHTAWLWDVRSGETRAAGSPEAGPVSYARFSRDGRIIAALVPSGISIIDGRTGWALREPIRPKGAGPAVLNFDLSADGRHLAAALQDGSAMLFEVFGTNSRTLFASSSGNEGSPPPMRFVKFSRDNLRLVTASDDGRIMMWQLDVGQRLFELDGHKDRVVAVDISSDGRLLLSASRDRTVRVYDASSGKSLVPPLQHAGELSWAGFDPAGERIATVSDKTVRLWSPRTGDILRTLSHADPLAGFYPVQFSLDGGRLATAAGDRLQLWDVRTGESVLGPLPHPGLIVSIRFSPNGKRLVTASSDGNAYVWDAATGYPVNEPLPHSNRVTYAEISPDGTRIVTSSLDHWVRLWPMMRAPLPPPSWLPELAEAVAGQRLDEQNRREVVPVRQLFELRQKLHANRGAGYYAGWARWFFADSLERPSVDLFEPASMPISQEAP